MPPTLAKVYPMFTEYNGSAGINAFLTLVEEGKVTRLDTLPTGTIENEFEVVTAVTIREPRPGAIVTPTTKRFVQRLHQFNAGVEKAVAAAKANGNPNVPVTTALSISLVTLPIFVGSYEQMLDALTRCAETPENPNGKDVRSILVAFDILNTRTVNDGVVSTSVIPETGDFVSNVKLYHARVQKEDGSWENVTHGDDTPRHGLQVVNVATGRIVVRRNTVTVKQGNVNASDLRAAMLERLAALKTPQNADAPADPPADKPAAPPKERTAPATA